MNRTIPPSTVELTVMRSNIANRKVTQMRMTILVLDIKILTELNIPHHIDNFIVYTDHITQNDYLLEQLASNFNISSYYINNPTGYQGFCLIGFSYLKIAGHATANRKVIFSTSTTSITRSTSLDYTNYGNYTYL